MKKFLIFLTIIVCLFSCKKETSVINNTPKKTDGYQIIGNISNFNNKEVYLQNKNLDKSYTVISKAIISNNKFSFSDAINNPKLVYIGFESSGYKVPVIINNFQTIINIDSKDLDNTTVLGSKLQTNHTNYLTNLAKAKNKFVFKLNYIKSNANSIISVVILEQMLGKTKWRLGQNRKAFEYLSSEMKTSELGQNIHAFLLKNEPLVIDEIAIEEVSLDPKVATIIPKIHIIKEAPKKEVKPIVKKKPVVKKITRRKAINFTAESQNGGNISLAEVKNGAKVTLVDFWASWCGPCRKTHPHLKRLYNKYHSKGFNIISVSEDKETDKNKWQNAIAVDGLPWSQVIDDYGRLAEMYNVQSVPHSFLLDENGGIIFHKKSMYTLEQKLKEIFGF